MRTLILGDVHGSYKGMLQCFKKSKFDYKKDRLIVLGDVCDGWSQVKECVDELMKIKHLDYILGNHDEWAWMWGRSKGAWTDIIWTSQGGEATKKSYNFEMPDSHVKFFQNSMLFLEEDNKIFVHGGIIPAKTLEETHKDVFLWDRELIELANKLDWQWVFSRRTDKKAPKPKITDYDEIFIGHTTTKNFKTTEPVHYCEVWDLDTGAGWGGKLTIMDLDTKEYWQSDYSYELYPEEKERR